jgi:hypothetical protein
MLPDGSLDEGSQKMLKDVGDWMRINGAGIYGSHAWTKFGEKTSGDNGLKSTDFRFTLGKDGAIYAFSFGVPGGGDQIKITSMGSDSKYLKSAIKSVTLLGSNDPINWKQDPDGLTISCPPAMSLKISAVFKITCDPALMPEGSASRASTGPPVLSPNDTVLGVKTTANGNPTVYGQNGDYGGSRGTPVILKT